MEKVVKKFIEEAEGVSLSASEKAAAGKNVMDFVKENPVSEIPNTSGAKQVASSASTGISGGQLASIVVGLVIVAGVAGVVLMNDVVEPAMTGTDGENTETVEVVDDQEATNDVVGEDNESTNIDQVDIDNLDTTNTDPEDPTDTRSIPGVIYKTLEDYNDYVNECTLRKIEQFLDEGGNIDDLMIDDNYLNIIDACAEEFETQSTTHDDKGEVSNETEITGPYGPKANQ